MYSFTNISVAGDPWKAPDKYLKMKNPEKADTASIAAGKVLYNKHCASCHGKKDLGDGIKAAQFDIGRKRRYAFLQKKRRFRMKKVSGV